MHFLMIILPKQEGVMEALRLTSSPAWMRCGVPLDTFWRLLMSFFKFSGQVFKAVTLMRQ